MNSDTPKFVYTAADAGIIIALRAENEKLKDELGATENAHESTAKAYHLMREERDQLKTENERLTKEHVFYSQQLAVSAQRLIEIDQLKEKAERLNKILRYKTSAGFRNIQG